MIYLIADLGFGDGGKGKVVDYLCDLYNATLVFRYTGGPQSSHSVMRGRTSHNFRHFGSGTFTGALTHVGPYVRVDPLSIMIESVDLEGLGVQNPLDMITVDGRCVIVTPYHAAHSRAKASMRWGSGSERGTFAMGNGTSYRYAQEFPEDAIYAKDCFDYNLLCQKLELMKKRYADVMKNDPDPIDLSPQDIAQWFIDFANQVRITNDDDWQRMLSAHEVIIGEGTQGLLIDRDFGFKPYVTSSDVSFNHAMEMIGDNDDHAVVRYGLLRGYSSRHGIGPFPTEVADLESKIPETDNSDEAEFLGGYRKGWLDLHLAEKAIDYVGGVDALCVGHLDHLEKLGTWSYAHTQRLFGKPLVLNGNTSVDDYLQIISDMLNVPIHHVSFGPKRSDSFPSSYEPQLNS